MAKNGVFKSKVLRYPRLDTVLMVEDAIRASKGDKTSTAVWKSLRKKVMWQTFRTILDYLEYSGKILMSRDKRIVWIGNERLLSKVRKHGVEA
ncbi:MAG: hypothetical protein PHF51_01645 [Candidatus ainarchaeum sp.]|nr:hypothetical protein [Candidatus ainarchaeum sp.]